MSVDPLVTILFLLFLVVLLLALLLWFLLSLGSRRAVLPPEREVNRARAATVMTGIPGVSMAAETKPEVARLTTSQPQRTQTGKAQRAAEEARLRLTNDPSRVQLEAKRVDSAASKVPDGKTSLFRVTPKTSGTPQSSQHPPGLIDMRSTTTPAGSASRPAPPAYLPSPRFDRSKATPKVPDTRSSSVAEESEGASLPAARAHASYLPSPPPATPISSKATTSTELEQPADQAETDTVVLKELPQQKPARLLVEQKEVADDPFEQFIRSKNDELEF